ncbi:MAG: class I SAM-dependent methyltransferase [Azonexus sp.]|nr:class I SAM-dependent methyltransferase [Azonexus sp.]
MTGNNPTRQEGWQFDCRVCGGETFCVIDLGNHPFANALLSAPENHVKRYPLALHVCASCATAQLSYCANDHELYDDYLYITPRSDSLTVHYAHIADFLASRGALGPHTRVAEIGSNIGRLLEFLQPRVASILGIDPAANVAQMANEAGIPTVNAFFNRESAIDIREREGQKDLMLARHCFAHNEKPWLMLEGVRELLAPEGTLLIENAYFLDTVARGEFDQIYHEHMYYHTLRSISAIVERQGMTLVDAYHSDIHGGTMVYIIRFAEAAGPISPRLQELLAKEGDMHRPAFYTAFTRQIEQNKVDLNTLLDGLLVQGQRIHAYGASAKSTTLLNYYGLDAQRIPCVVDSTPEKQGKYIPQVNCRIISEEAALADPADYYLLTIWNYKDEVIRKVRSRGNQHSRFILPHPEVQIADA